MKKVLITADMLASKENNDLFCTMYRYLSALSRTDRFAIAEINDDPDGYEWLRKLNKVFPFSTKP
jgi:hypothetical protein